VKRLLVALAAGTLWAVSMAVYGFLGMLGMYATVEQAAIVGCVAGVGVFALVLIDALVERGG